MADEAPHRFELIEHTADIGIAVDGRDEAELIANAAFGLFAVIAELETVVPRSEVAVEAAGHDPEERLQATLSELLYLQDVEGWLFCRFPQVEVAGERVRLLARGERLDPARHVILRQVKAVTFHGLEVKRTGDRLRAQVIFDL